MSENLPFWSVMVPVYMPNQFLEEALESVLCQGIGKDRMQIRVIDNCSPEQDVGERVTRIGGDRIEFSTNDRNLGLAGNWNQCVKQAKGDWIHILHHDDLVLPGFYRRFEALFAATSSPSANWRPGTRAFRRNSTGRSQNGSDCNAPPWS